MGNNMQISTQQMDAKYKISRLSFPLIQPIARISII